MLEAVVVVTAGVRSRRPLLNQTMKSLANHIYIYMINKLPNQVDRKVAACQVEPRRP